MPRTYVYAAFGGPEQQRFEESPRPTPASGQLLIKVHAAGVNPADWKQRSNRRQSADPVTRPVPMGLEAAGVVEELGDEVTDFQVGDRVFGSVAGNGGFSDYSLLPVAQSALIPPEVSFIDASTLPVAGATAYDGVHQLQLRPGETLLIVGVGGGVGIAAAQIAISMGVRVVGTASEAKRELVEGVGATHISYGEGVVDRIRRSVPEGIAAIYDMVGGAALREVADLLSDRSRLISIGDSDGAVALGGVRIDRKRNIAVLEAVATLVANGDLKPYVTTIVPLERVGEALALVESGHATGKVVVEVA